MTENCKVCDSPADVRHGLCGYCMRRIPPRHAGFSEALTRMESRLAAAGTDEARKRIEESIKTRIDELILMETSS